MDDRLVETLRTHHGVATRTQLLAAAPHHVLDRAVSAGHLIRVLPRVYATTSAMRSPSTRLFAALAFAGAGAALSHTTALAQWSLPVPEGGPVHVTTPTDRDRRSTGGVLVHRRSELVVVRGELPTIALAESLVDAWAVLPAARRREPLITAVRKGLVTAADVESAAKGRANWLGRAQLLALTEMLNLGCQSELEIWGHRSVFRHRSLPPSERQFAVVTAAGRYVLDVAWPELLLAVELDGAAFHGSRDDRERDIRRDAALAAAGWQVVRVTHARLSSNPAAVRREIATIVSIRRALFAVAG